MKDRTVYTIAIVLGLLLIVFFNQGCAKAENDSILVQSCSVATLGFDAVVICPDGTEVILPGDIVHGDVLQIEPIPVTINVNNRKDCKNSKKD